ncbi:MAG: ankyrin repeat domain-containing protein [Solirubrobacterales bacterium]|nr:ankyrin repeat domain-containing protein [Solirubrobacterales bacterium]
MTSDALRIPADDPLAQAARAALTSGDVGAVSALIAEHPELATARVVTEGEGAGERTLLHVFADYPGRRPRAREIVAVLKDAGADLDAPFVGSHSETALHWAASNDDIQLIDALLDHGADIEARGAIIGGGTAMADATAFGRWMAADRLALRGAQTTLFESACLGLVDRVHAELAAAPDPDDVSAALWGAAAGGRRVTASILLEHGADPNWVGSDRLTAVDAAQREGATRLAEWLRKRGGRSAAELAQAD